MLCFVLVVLLFLLAHCLCCMYRRFMRPSRRKLHAAAADQPACPQPKPQPPPQPQPRLAAGAAGAAAGAETRTDRRQRRRADTRAAACSGSRSRSEGTRSDGEAVGRVQYGPHAVHGQGTYAQCVSVCVCVFVIVVAVDDCASVSDSLFVCPVCL